MKAGRIDQDWLAGARCNETEGNRAEDWFATYFNAPAEIGPDGSLWVGRHYKTCLEQEAIDKACIAIDKGI